MKKASIIGLYATYFFDLVGLVLVYIIFSPLIVNPAVSILPYTFSYAERNLVLGCLLAIYPLGQFFAALIYGDLSDKFGRRPILLITTLVTAIGFLLSAIAITTSSIALLFLSRLITGLGAGNMTVAQATVTNLAPDDKKEQASSVFSWLGGTAWTIGPFLGMLFALISRSAPLYFMALLFLVLFILILITLEEPKFEHTEHSHSLSQMFTSITSVITQSSVKHVFYASAITMFGWMMYQGYLAPYLIQKYHFAQDIEGLAYAISSVFWFLGGLTCTLYLFKRTIARKVILAPMFASALAVLAFTVSGHEWLVWPLMAISNFTQAIVTSCFFALFATLVTPDKHGRIFGGWNSGFALASALGPALAGLFAALTINLPYIIAGLILLATTIYYFKKAHISKRERV